MVIRLRWQTFKFLQKGKSEKKQVNSPTELVSQHMEASATKDVR